MLIRQTGLVCLPFGISVFGTENLPPAPNEWPVSLVWKKLRSEAAWNSDCNEMRRSDVDSPRLSPRFIMRGPNLDRLPHWVPHSRHRSREVESSRMGNARRCAPICEMNRLDRYLKHMFRIAGLD